MDPIWTSQATGLPVGWMSSRGRQDGGGALRRRKRELWRKACCRAHGVPRWRANTGDALADV